LAPPKAVLQDQGIASPKTALAPTASPTPYFPQTKPLEERQPVSIQSKKLFHNEKLQLTRFVGSVKASQGSTHLDADELSTRNRGDQAEVKGHVRIWDPERKLDLQSDRASWARRMESVELHEGVRLHSVDAYGRPVTVTSQSAAYSALSRTAELDGQVRAVSAGSRFQAEHFRFQGTEDLVILDGDVRASFIPAQLEALTKPSPTAGKSR
jgi:lipopolysaccharide export system protein LptA